MQAQDIIRMRVRLQRLEDARIASGWVTEIDGSSIIVDGTTAFSVSTGDMFFFEIASNGCRIVFTGRLVGRSAKGMRFELIDSFKSLESQEEPRFLVENLSALVKTDWTEFRGKIVDISRRGLALETNVPLEREEELSLEIESEPFTILADGQVRYCRKCTRMPNAYRVGVLLNGFDRLNTAKWRKLFSSKAA